MKTYRLPPFILAAAAAFLMAPSARSATPLEQAAVAMKAGDLATAETVLVPLTTAAPANAEALHRLGEVRLQQKRTKEAVELAEKATQADGSKPEYFSQLGMALAAQMNEVNFMQMAMLSGRMKKAFQKSVDLDPHHLPGLIGLVRYYTNAPEMVGGSLEKARAFAARVGKLDPYLGEVELGRIANKDEDTAGALAHFEAAVKLKPENPSALTLAGKALAKLDRKPEARARFEAALKAAPAFEPARKALAELE